MNIAIILAAGKGTRMQEKTNKILLSLLNKPVICHTLAVFEECNLIDYVILVANKSDFLELESIIKKNGFKKVKDIVAGGEHRQDSVYNGFNSIKDADDDDIIVVHNAANTEVTVKMITDIIEAAKKYNAAAVGFPIEDTVKHVELGFVAKTFERGKLWRIQTPQAIKYNLMKMALDRAYEDNFYATDDVSLIERLGKEVKIIECSADNIKITRKHDIEFIEMLRTAKRVGLGQDSHKIVSNRPLYLGGYKVTDEYGLEADSDGDVILHALYNALSQAISSRSLGYYATPLCLNGITDSKEYIEIALELVENKGFKIGNIGIMTEAKKPRILDYDDEIKKSLASLLKIDKEKIGITATSGDELTPFGKGEAIQAFVIATLVKADTFE